MVNSVIPPALSQQCAYLCFRQSKLVYFRTETVVLTCGAGNGEFVVFGGWWWVVKDGYISNVAIAPPARR